ncbi:hypothetical protein G9H71_13385, partial [Motilibacter sp. E257]
GQTVTLDAVVAPMSVLDRYEWWVQKAGAAEPSKVEGVSGARYAFTADASFDGAKVSVKLVKNTGATYVSSEAVTVEVAAAEPTLAFTPLRNHYHQGGTIAFTLN